MQNDQHMGTVEDRDIIIGIRDSKDDIGGVIGRLVDDGLIGLPEVCGVGKGNMTLFVAEKAIEMLKAIKPSLRNKCFHFLSVLYIKSLILDKEFDEVDEKEVGLKCSPILTTLSREIYGKKGWSDVVKTLIEIGAIKIDFGYCRKKYSRHYGLLKPFNQEIQRFDLKVGTLLRKYRERLKKRAAREFSRSPVEWVIKSFDDCTFSTSEESMLSAQNFRSEHAKNCAINSLESVTGHYHSFGRCAAGRLYYPITSLKKDFRKKLLINGEQVVEIDAVACQPFLHASLYPDSCDEREKYLAAVSSPEFYEKLASWDGGFSGTRDECKKKVFKDLYYGSIYKKPLPKIWRWFCLEYPVLAEQMESVKMKGNSVLPSLMQKIESNIVIDDCVQRLRDANIPVLPMHDAIVVPVSQKEIAQNLLKESWVAVVGFAPRFKS